MPTPYLSRLNIPMKAGYTPSQGTGGTPITGGGSPYEPPINSNGMTYNGGRNPGQQFMGANRFQGNGSIGIPSDRQYSGNMSQQYINDLLAQQKNNAAAYGYDAAGNWSLLNGQQDYVDANGSKTAYQPLFEQYAGMRPTGYSGSVPGRTNGVAPALPPPDGDGQGRIIGHTIAPQTRTEIQNPTLTNAPGSGGGAPLPGDENPTVNNFRTRGRRSDSQAYGGAAQYNQFQNYNNPLGTGLGEMYQGGTPYSGVNTGVNMDFSKALWR
jgi:hypothetical protein